MNLMIRVWEKVRNLFSLALFFMILFRVVWLQLRPYEALFPGLRQSHTQQWFCDKGVYPAWNGMIQWVCELSWVADSVVAWNLKIFFITIAILMIALRILSKSWLVAIICAMVVLSRGSLTAMMGYSTPDGLMMLLFAMWVICMTHIAISASQAVFYFATFLLFLCCFFEKSFIALWLVPYLFFMSYPCRAVGAEPLPQGRLFRKLSVRLSAWLATQRFFHSVSFLFFLVPFLFLCVFVKIDLSMFTHQIQLFKIDRLDAHYLLSGVALFLGVLFHPDLHCRESLCLILYSMLSLILGQCILNLESNDLRYLFGYRDALGWIEPVVLAFGAYLWLEILKYLFLIFYRKMNQLKV